MEAQVGTGTDPMHSTTVRRIRLIVLMFLLNLLIFLLLLHAQATIASGIRTFIRAEGIWGKAQKQAHILLTHYAWTRDEASYRAYLEQMQVPLGAHKLHLALQQPVPDMQAARSGFIEGNNAPQDFEDLITVFRWFKGESHMANALAIWSAADRQFARYRQLGSALHEEITAYNPREEEIQRLLSGLAILNEQLADMALRFSDSQSSTARFAASVGWWGSLVVMAFLLGITLLIAWRITRSIEQTEHALEQSEGRFRQLSHHDFLTGLPNRFLLHELVHKAILQAKRRNTHLALLFLDLDNFKAINDTYGHHAGDEVLKQVARRLASVIRATDTIARLGGDEFVVLLEELSDRANATQIAELILHTFTPPFPIAGNEVSISMSIGIGCFPEDGDSLEALTKSADAAMYRVKLNGKNSYGFPTPRYG